LAPIHIAPLEDFLTGSTFFMTFGCQIYRRFNPHAAPIPENSCIATGKR
jgi:hypothetical protein